MDKKLNPKQTVMEEELVKIINRIKPCPFCGRMPKIETCEGYNWDGKQKHVNIGGCYGLWIVSCPCEDWDCAVHPATAWYPAMTSAVEAWNRRNNDIT